MDDLKTDYLPLGSVVILKGGVQKIVLVARGMVVEMDGVPKFFEYGGSLYPQGIVSEHIMYFNSGDIQKVIFEGYTDDDDSLMIDNINEWFESSGFEKGDSNKINQEIKEEDNASS